VYSSCGGGGLRCNVLYRWRPLNFQYPVNAEPLVFLSSLWPRLCNKALTPYGLARAAKLPLTLCHDSAMSYDTLQYSSARAAKSPLYATILLSATTPYGSARAVNVLII
jgi:hypothetical protein